MILVASDDALVRVTWILAIATIVLAVATVALAVASFRSIKESQRAQEKQIRANRDERLASQDYQRLSAFRAVIGEMRWNHHILSSVMVPDEQKNRGPELLDPLQTDVLKAALPYIFTLPEEDQAQIEDARRHVIVYNGLAARYRLSQAGSIAIVVAAPLRAQAQVTEAAVDLAITTLETWLTREEAEQT